MNKWFRACFIIFLMSVTSQARAWADTRNVTFGANESPPFWSSDMQDGGLGGEILNAISRKAGLNSAITFKPLQRLIDDDVGNDLGNPIFFMGNQDYSAIIPIVIYQSALFYYAPNHDAPIIFRGLEDLKRYRIGILKGTLLDRAYFNREGITFAESYSQESLFKKLKLGRVDLVLEIDAVGFHMIDRLFPDEGDAFHTIILPKSSNPIAMMLAEDTPASIAQKYRGALKEIIADGTYHKVLERYFGEGQIPEDWFDHLDKFSRLYGFGGDE